MKTNPLVARLRHHVSGAIERGEKQAIACVPAINPRVMYLDYVNNFLTVARFAEYYGMTADAALSVIEEGKAAHEAAVNRGAA